MLNSVSSTALSGIAAADLAINLTANHLANSLTDGFRSSRAVFADQTPQTLNHGSATWGSSGGGNPTQVGRGVGVAAVDVKVRPTPADSTGVSPEAADLSDTNLAAELINLTLYSTMYRANLRVLKTSDALLEDLFNLRRS